MKHFALLAAVIVVFAMAATAQRKDTSHASREAAIHLLQREGHHQRQDTNGKRRVERRRTLVVDHHPRY